MKPNLKWGLLALIGFGCIPQKTAAQTFAYSYDLSGNRIKKELHLDDEPHEPELSKKSASHKLMAEAELEVYPIPAQDQILVKSSDDNYSRAIILSLEGKALIEQSIKKGLNAISLQSLSAGIYSLQLLGEQHQQFVKIIKQ